MKGVSVLKKKIICIIVALSLFFSQQVFGNEKDISIYLNNRNLKIDDVIVRNNRALVPYNCGIFENLGYSTYYDAINQEVVIKNSKDLVTIYLNDYVIYKNGLTSYTADIRCDFADNQIYVPLRGFLESLSHKVKWENVEKRIIIDF